MNIKLRLVNESNTNIAPDIVLFQKNVVGNFDEQAVAWQVIHNLQEDYNHPFVFAMDTTIAAVDNWGNFTPQLAAQYGQQFAMVLTTSGDELKHSGNASSITEIECVNSLDQGEISVNIYRSGKLLATKTAIAPGQKAVFQFRPTVWVGCVSRVVQGQIMNSAILSEINTEISLLGIASADIVMTGGGPGPNSTPFQFNLDNVVML